MRTSAIWRRMGKLERRSAGDGDFTLEELYRSIWRTDPARYRSLVAEHCGVGMSILLPGFEREDAERAKGTRR
jgi:hypothetical protein